MDLRRGQTFKDCGKHRVADTFKGVGFVNEMHNAVIVDQGYEAVNGRQDGQRLCDWIAFAHDTQSLALKTAFAVQSGMGGVAVWQLTGDMVNGRHLLLPGIRARLNQPEPPAPARLLRPLGGRTP